MKHVLLSSLYVISLSACGFQSPEKIKEDTIKKAQDARKQDGKENLIRKHSEEIEALNFIRQSADFPIALPPYEPAKEPWILVDRTNPRNFLSLNLNLPSNWISISPLPGITESQAPEAFSLSQNPVFDFLFRSNSSLPVSKIFDVNPEREGIFLSLTPHTNLGIEYPGGLTYIMLHEGFHLYVQFLHKNWAWSNEDTGIPREDAQTCIDNKNKFVLDEYSSLNKIWDVLEANASNSDLKKSWQAWRDIRDHRLSKIPSVQHDNGVNTDCRIMDRIYHRLEGLPDYASFSMLMKRKKVTFSSIKKYYNEVIPLDLEGGYYASGSALAFILDKIEPEGLWKKQVIEDPNSSLDEMVAQKMELID